jgi:hypothetical protein
MMKQHNLDGLVDATGAFVHKLLCAGEICRLPYIFSQCRLCIDSVIYVLVRVQRFIRVGRELLAGRVVGTGVYTVVPIVCRSSDAKSSFNATTGLRSSNAFFTSYQSLGIYGTLGMIQGERMCAHTTTCDPQHASPAWLHSYKCMARGGVVGVCTTHYCIVCCVHP